VSSARAWARRLAAGALAALLAGAAAAEDRALVVVNRDYRDLEDIAAGEIAAPLRAALERAGFAVTVVDDATTGGLLSALRRMAAEPDPEGAAVFYYMGYARQLRGRTFLVARNAKPAVPFDFVTQGVDLDSILKSLADAGGRVQLAVIDGAYAEPRLDGLEGLEPGLPEPAPGGTAAVVLGAPPGAILPDAAAAPVLARALADALAEPGRALGTVLADFAAGAEGAVGRRIHVALGDAAGGEPLMRTAPPPEPAPEAPAGRDGFVAAPEGAEAQEQPAAGEPAASAEPLPAAEFEATLDPEARRRVQRALRALGLYDAGIDGAFGPLTRRGIETFQRLRGFEPTGRLDAEQMRLLFEIAGQ
jgi:hypothetical protein